MADIFVSYTASDRDWAFWIAKELQTMGHEPRVHEWEIKGGDDIFAWMRDRLDTAHYVLCVVSDDYLRAPYSELERHAALWKAAKNRKRFVLFVAVRWCQLPALTDHFLRCELFGVAEQDARTRFRDFMQRDQSDQSPLRVVFPGRVFAVSNVPIRVPPHFMGREDALASIDKALHRYEGRVAITALYGLRGVGKTMLAAAYADSRRAVLRATWWIRAQTVSTMRADLVGLGVRLGWVDADAKEELALAGVMERLRHDADGILLIYDNAADADALEPYLPDGGNARILVTSNTHRWGEIAEPVEIRLWPKEIGADYLLARTRRRDERAAAEQLSNALGGLPLAHEQAAAYCEDIGIGLAEYLHRFEVSADLLADPEHMSRIYRDEQADERRDRRTVAGTFSLAIEQAAKRHLSAEPLITALAVLPPEPIPLLVLTEGREKLGIPLSTLVRGSDLDKGIAALRTFALVDREAIVDERNPTVATDCIRLHRLVRRVALTRRDLEAYQSMRAAWIDALRAVYPPDSWSHVQAWPLLRRLDPILEALVGGDSPLPQGSDENVVALLHLAGVYREDVLASYASARLLFERALAICKTAFGLTHSRTAASLCHLASVLQHQGDFTAAQVHIDEVLEIYKTLLAPAHADGKPPKADGDHETPVVLNELTTLLRDQGDFAAALPVAERALSMCETVLGPKHPATAIALSNLARLLERERDFEGARPLYSRALDINRDLYGLDHPETATSFSAYGRVLRDLSDMEIAKSYFDQAIRTGDKLLGAEHPLTQRYHSHYARLFLTTGVKEEALRRAEAALAIHERTNGRNHNWTKDSARVAADALAALGRAKEARELRKKYRLEQLAGDGKARSRRGARSGSHNSRPRTRSSE